MVNTIDHYWSVLLTTTDRRGDHYWSLARSLDEIVVLLETVARSHIYIGVGYHEGERGYKERRLSTGIVP